ncbi:MAG: proton-conducting transporter membrane subunit [Candidatus Dormibacter sp.]|uniref:proton-conducting transporter transmembrane domain-containing protein n=1 Tax=Candidatus Dormibacter sp. TaxID=2973982 RepID=UPI000DB3CAF6|nr:MAG: hypothetical protein DLM66_13325 [Candidatus Dormibacteraeota bacterium]
MRVTALLPEAVILATAAGLPLGRRLLPERRELGWLAPLAVVAALLLELWLGAQVGSLFSGGWLQDRFSLFAKAALLLGLLVFVVVDREPEAWPDLEALAFLAVFGGMVAVSAPSLVGLWAGLELAALAGVAAGGFSSRTAASELLFVSAGAGGLLALGFAFLYALTGTTSLAGLRLGLAHRQLALPLALIVLLVLSGLALRLALAPLAGNGGRTADSRGQAVPAALLSAVALLVAAKLLPSLAAATIVWAPWLAVLSAAAMLLGGLRAAALLRPERQAVWLAVAQVGWVGAALAIPQQRGTAAALFLLGCLLFAWVGAALLARLEPSALAGLTTRDPLRAAGLGLALLSLAGAPPLGGFFGEFAVAAELIRSDLGWVLAAGLLGWMAGLYGVIRTLARSYLEAAPEPPRRGPRPAPVWTVSALLPAVLVLGYGLFAFPIHSLASQGAAALGLR